MTHDYQQAKAAFDRAAECFLDAVDALRDDQWDEPGLGEWTIRELVGHCTRAFVTVVQFVDNPRDDVDRADVGEYVRAAMAIPDVHAGVAGRGREEGRNLGDDPRAVVRQRRADAGAALARCRGYEVGLTAAGGMTLEQYLPTRIVELVVHTLDLCAAASLPWPELGSAGTAALTAIAQIPAEPADQAAILRALFGRVPLPDGFNLFG